MLISSYKPISSKLVPLFTILVTCIGCYSEIGGDRGFAPKSSYNNSNLLPPEIHLETFTTDPQSSKKKRELDVLFIVDNSSSMKEEMKHVKNNLENLFNQLKAITSAQIALLTKICKKIEDNICKDYVVERQYTEGERNDDPNYGGLSMILPENIKLIEINRRVASDNGILITTNYINGTDSFFREDSVKAFVIVSDADMAKRYQNDFIDSIKKKFDSSLETIAFFGFLYLTEPPSDNNNPEPIIKQTNKIKIHRAQSPKPDCQSNNPAIEYYRMLEDNNFLEAGLYDICEQNWEINFTDIANKLKTIFTVSGFFKLEKTADSIKSVKINGEIVDQSKYSLKGNKLFFVEDFLDKENQQTIEVEYIL